MQFSRTEAFMKTRIFMRRQSLPHAQRRIARARGDLTSSVSYALRLFFLESGAEEKNNEDRMEHNCRP